MDSLLESTLVTCLINSLGHVPNDQKREIKTNEMNMNIRNQYMVCSTLTPCWRTLLENTHQLALLENTHQLTRSCAKRPKVRNKDCVHQLNNYECKKKKKETLLNNIKKNAVTKNL